MNISFHARRTLRIVRHALRTVMTASGAVIALRALLGPLTFPLKVTNPCNPEDWFALALVLTMLAGTDAPRSLSQNSGATI